MPARTSSIPPKINIGGLTGLPWLQKGYSYGSNDSGPFQVWIEEGLDADIDADALNFENYLWTYTVERLGNGISRLSAHAGWRGGSTYTAEVFENIWELDPQEAEKDILNSDFPNGASLALTSKKTREALAKINQDAGATWAAPGSAAGTVTMTSRLVYTFDDGAGGADTKTYIALPSADYAPARSLYLLMQAGVEAFPVEASIIRHTRLLSNLYTVKASYSNVGRIISTASMTSIEGAPTTLLFDVPALPTPLQFIETAGDLQYGWKKARPAVTRLAKFKWRVVQNWQLGLWPVKLFGNVL